MSGWSDECPPLPADDQQLEEMAWQEQLLRWRDYEERLAEMIRRGCVDFTLLDDPRRLAREHQADIDEERRDGYDYREPDRGGW